MIALNVKRSLAVKPETLMSFDALQRRNWQHWMLYSFNLISVIDLYAIFMALMETLPKNVYKNPQ